MYSPVESKLLSRLTSGWWYVMILLIMLASPSTLEAQNLSRISELRQQLNLTRGKEQVPVLNALAWEFRSAYPDSTIKYAQKAIALAESLHIPRTATSLNYIGLAHYYKGSFVNAYEFYDRALQKAASTSDTVELGYANNNIGRLFSEQGMLDESFPYFVRAESFFESTSDKAGLAYVYQSFANLYKTQKDFVKSEQNYQRALKIRRELGQTREVMSAMVLLGKLYLEIQQFDDALMYFSKADSASAVIDDNLARSEIKILMSEYYLNQKDLDLAEKLCSEGLKYILNFNNVKLVPRGYLILGQIAFEKKDYGASKKYLSIAESLSSRMKYLDLKMHAHYELWRLSDILGERESALFHSNQYLVLKDSINDIDISGRMAKFQFQLAIERKQQEFEQLKSRAIEDEAIIKEQNFQRTTLSLLVLFVTFLFYLQWRHAQRRKIANAALRQQRDKIQDQANEINKQLKYIAEKHGEVTRQKDEIATINSKLSEKLEEISSRNATLESHLNTLLNFSKSKSINFGSIKDAVGDIARLTASTLSVSRVSVWVYNESVDSIESVAIYDSKSDSFLEPATISLVDYPAYGKALRSKKVITANNAREDEDTREFNSQYLTPLNIHSMLDAVYYSTEDKFGGLICCEQQEEARDWKPEDVLFATSVSDVISLAYRSIQRREYERRLRQQTKEIARMNEMLEERVRERTLELENQNKQLSEYAFINSHLLRSPVSKIMGLLNLLEVDETADHKQIDGFLKSAVEELDAVVKKITVALDGGEHFDRKVIRFNNQNIEKPGTTV